MVTNGRHNGAVRALCVAALSGALVPSGAQAQAGLAGEKDINDGLFVIAVADKINRSCDQIAARVLRARRYANHLKGVAADRGYSEDQIDAYLHAKPEKTKMRARRDAYFLSRGANKQDAQSLCDLGRAEIAAETPIGQLLRVR